jgi:hypothetical protein
MTDTPDFIYKKQFEIIFSKTPKERFLMGFEMIESVKRIVENSIRREMPNISDIDLRVSVFKRYYQNDFTPPQLEKIAAALFAYHTNKAILPPSV